MDRECLRCGYVTQNDEIDREEPPGRCPECGAALERGYGDGG